MSSGVSRVILDKCKWAENIPKIWGFIELAVAAEACLTTYSTPPVGAVCPGPLRPYSKLCRRKQGPALQPHRHMPHCSPSWVLSRQRDHVYACVLSRFSCVPLCNPMDHTPPGSLSMVAMPSSKGSSQPRDRICVSCGSYVVGKFLTSELLGKPRETAVAPQNALVAAQWPPARMPSLLPFSHQISEPCPWTQTPHLGSSSLTAGQGWLWALYLHVPRAQHTVGLYK